MKYVVTGGAGFIGSHIVTRLVAMDRHVVVVDNLSTGSRANLAHVEEKVELVVGDIRDQELVQDVIARGDVVLHQAALPSVPRSLRDPLTSNEHNVTGTLTVLDAARKKEAARVVYASSSSVYGDNPVLPKTEQLACSPISPYAASKYAGELYCRVYQRAYGLEIVVLRYFNVFGPRQDPASEYAAVIPKFITLMLRGQPPDIYGDGTQSRDFTYVENVVQANLLAASVAAAAGEVFNVGCGQRHTLLSLVAGINLALGTDLTPRFVEGRAGDVQHSLASITRARTLLGYNPAVQFDRGLQKTVEWFRAEE